MPEIINRASIFLKDWIPAFAGMTRPQKNSVSYAHLYCALCIIAAQQFSRTIVNTEGLKPFQI